MNKRGDFISFETLIFIILNIFFCVILLLSIFKSSYGALVYEQTYSKNIALMIDNAKPDITIEMNMADFVDLVKKYDSSKKVMSSDDILKNAVRIDRENNKITVTMEGRTGYSFRYFSDYDVSLDVRGVFLIIKVTERIV